MPTRTKREGHPTSDDKKTAKRVKLELPTDTEDSAVRQHLLPFYYAHVCSLRSFIRAKCLDKRARLDQRLQYHTFDSCLARLLDTTLVGCPSDPTANLSRTTTSELERIRRTKDFFEFTQRSSGSSNRRISDGTTIASTLGEGSLSMAEIVDFVVWRLFNRTYRLVERPPHVLCHGFRRSTEPKSTVEDRAAQGGIDGLTRVTTNSQVERLREEDWSELLRELGFDGDHVMLELLLDCAVFLPIGQTTAACNKTGNYWQLSGVSVAEAPQLRVSQGPLPRMAAANSAFKTPSKPAMAERSASAISFVRSRLFYARATLNGKGRVHFGLRHIHVFNRYPDPGNDVHAKHILKHIFPKQFGLHNVFISAVDRRETAHPFKDYTLREHEIVAWTQKRGTREAAKLPKRLRGQCMQLVKKLLKLHRSCPYKELLFHYCPVQELDDPRALTLPVQKKKRKRVSDGLFPASTAARVQAKAMLTKPGSNDGKHLTELATSSASVSAFVRSVIWTILPRDLLGDGTDGAANFQHLLESIHKFVMCKRFENLTLDSVTRNIKIGSIEWLRSPNVSKVWKLSKSDFSKRQELMGELLYYVFDSLVIPLIRSNFHVTESNDHKYRLFYFRHDVWRLITQPALSRIKLNMFREIPTAKAQQILEQRTLGYSQVRLLPKRTSVRPITNLRRRAMVKRRGKTYLAASINSTMRNVFSILNYEKNHQPGLLQSSIFSVNELYPQLIRFQESLKTKGLAGQPLYFVKVDVQSCFDTIPQRRVVDLVERICHGIQYTIKHHAEVKSALPEATFGITRGTNKPTRKFLAPAHGSRSSQTGTFAELLERQYTRGKKNTVFAEGAVQTKIDIEAMLDLLDEHVMRNIVRIGKKYYRQKNGIPQGSILSSLLCSFFYGDFEARKLSFLRKPTTDVRPCETILIRLIDDFLLITTERNHAEKFLGTMLAGDADYGITVKPEKTLASFKPSSDSLVTETKIGEPFPWCNVLINTRTLAVTRDRTNTVPYLPNLVQSKGSLLKLRDRVPDLADSMNVETQKRAGAAFHRKVMAMLRINMRAMYIDMCTTPMPKVMRELFIGVLEVAEKASRYLVSLQKLNGVGLRSKVVQQTLQNVAHSTSALLKKGRRSVDTRIDKANVEFLVVKAFQSVFGRQRSRYMETLAWLGEWDQKLQVDRQAMAKVLKIGSS